jgi:hypothetical protein
MKGTGTEGKESCKMNDAVEQALSKTSLTELVRGVAKFARNSNRHGYV